MMLRILLLCNGNAYVDIVCCHETMYFALSLVFLLYILCIQPIPLKRKELCFFSV